ncbi:hypothetical protein MHU86_24664 [Fragilaria crotonensis]|nr:hypothetical protein MHU86_24664 [Fragilaria crotonensis]
MLESDHVAFASWRQHPMVLFHQLHPKEPPPLPSEILGLLVLGEPQSGKTSLVRRFVYRTYASQIEQQRKQRHSSIEYHKKDLAFWYAKNETRCARVQLWDVSDCRTFGSSPQRNGELVQVLQRTKAIILVLSMEHGPQHVLREARSWKQWLQDLHVDDEKPIYWFLHKSDVLPNLETSISINLGAALANMSRELGFSSRYLTSCLSDDGSSVESAMMNVIRTSLQSESIPSLAHSSASSTDSKTILSAMYQSL